MLPPAVWNTTQQQPFHPESEVILSGRPFCCACISNTKRNGDYFTRCTLFGRYCNQLEISFLWWREQGGLQDFKLPQICFTRSNVPSANASNITALSDTFPQPTVDTSTSLPMSFPNRGLMSCDIPNKKSLVLMSPLPHPTTFPFEALRITGLELCPRSPLIWSEMN